MPNLDLYAEQDRPTQVDQFVQVTDQHSTLVQDLGIPAVVILMSFSFIALMYFFNRKDLNRFQKQQLEQDNKQQDKYVTSIMEMSEKIQHLESKLDSLMFLTDRRKTVKK